MKRLVLALMLLLAVSARAESDFMFPTPGTISGPVNSTVQVVIRVTTERRIAAVGVGFLFDHTKVQLLSLQKGQEIPANWSANPVWNQNGQAGAWIIGSGLDDDWIRGADLGVAILTFKILQCGTGTTLDLVSGVGGPDCNWCHMSTIDLVSVIDVECSGGCNPPEACHRTLYLTDGYVGGTACPRPPCGCDCGLEKAMPTWSNVKQLYN